MKLRAGPGPAARREQRQGWRAPPLALYAKPYQPAATTFPLSPRPPRSARAGPKGAFWPLRSLPRRWGRGGIRREGPRASSAQRSRPAQQSKAPASTQRPFHWNAETAGQRQVKLRQTWRQKIEDTKGDKAFPFSVRFGLPQPHDFRRPPYDFSPKRVIFPAKPRNSTNRFGTF